MSEVCRSARYPELMVVYENYVVMNLLKVISAALRNAKNSEGKSALEPRHSSYGAFSQ